jgi:hypothetical protein
VIAQHSKWDPVWYRSPVHPNMRNENSSLSSVEGGYNRHLTTFRSGLGLRSIRSQRSNLRRLAANIRQSTVAQRRLEWTDCVEEPPSADERG